VNGLDAEGPAAPPRLNGELVFEHPWQSRIFATTMALCENGLIVYEDLRERLIAQIADRPDQYWHSWSEALEDLLVGRGLCEADEVTERASRFAEHD
jgi:nitrile hydratase accessory protein